jgi:hypothetical protein
MHADYQFAIDEILMYFMRDVGLVHKPRVWRHFGKPKAIYQGVSPTQRDGNNCGAYLIENVKNILFHRNQFKSQFHVPKWADKLYSEKFNQVQTHIGRKKYRWGQKLEKGKWKEQDSPFY